MKLPLIAATILFGAGAVCAGTPPPQAQPQAPPGHRDGGGSTAAEQGCLAAVAQTVNVPRDRLSVLRVVATGAGFSVMVKVPEATAPWSCQSDALGHTSGVMFTGRDGD